MNNRYCAVPEPYCKIIDDICEQDRLYFENHPKSNSYVRPYCIGEFYPRVFEQTIIEGVKVLRVSKGVRARIPLIRKVDIKDGKLARRETTGANVKRLDLNKLKNMMEDGIEVYEITFPSGAGFYGIVPDVGRTITFATLTDLMSSMHYIESKHKG